MSLTSDERKSVVEFRIEKARRALEQAQGVVELQYWETIANRLYYAAYNAVSAMLMIHGSFTRWSHSSLWAVFCKTGYCRCKGRKIISSSFFYALNRRLR